MCVEIATVPSVLIVEDDPTINRLLVRLLEGAGYRPEAVGSGEDALALLEREPYSLVLLDLSLPGMSGLDVLSTAVPLQPDGRFVIMTAHAGVDTAVEAMRRGAYDYLVKPLRTEELLLTLERAVQDRELRREVTRLRRQTRRAVKVGLVGRSLPVQRMLDLIEQVAPTRATVLIQGETGTGKELVARTLHSLSDRAEKPFVPVNCSALPEGLLESELFGHVKGSFTGAVSHRRGLFEEANGGTLFLDEISTVSLNVQVKLLRVLEERAITRVGDNRPIATDFRLVTATNESLAEAVAERRFRQDLFYRLNVYPITVPPLRERPSDIPLLVSHFCARFAEQVGVPVAAVPAEELQRLVEHSWPGNVRELENCVERAVITHAGRSELRFDVADAPGMRPQPLLDRAEEERWSLERLEKEYILRVLRSTHENRVNAAAILGVDRRTLYRKLKDYDASA